MMLLMIYFLGEAPEMEEVFGCALDLSGGDLASNYWICIHENVSTMKAICEQTDERLV
jgi:hypothetical protein